jgi:hypothetical protein
MTGAAPVYRVAVSADGSRIAAGGDDGAVMVRDGAGDPRLVHRHARNVSSVALSPDGRWLLSSSWDRTARLTPLIAGAAAIDLVGSGEPVNAAVFAPDGASAITAAEDGAVRVWALDGATTRLLRAHDGFVTRLAVSRDGTVASAGADGALVRWSSALGARPAAGPGTISTARIGPDGVVRSPDGSAP